MCAPRSQFSSESNTPEAQAYLVQQLRARNPAAMTHFYTAYRRALYSLILRIVPQPEVAEDVLQDSMLKIWDAFLSYDATKGRLFTWALNVCRNTALDRICTLHYRSCSRTLPLEESPAWRQPATPGFRPEHIGLWELTRRLRPEYRAVIDLLYYGGYTQQETSDELAIPLGTVKTRAQAALRELGRQMR
ncbi:sigma-70 family RNA polymerase sigma factor [Hymenobacter algoricola]|uniref:Sigma-70 family RNA polymerase sigma factor n=2 Tax=Hymenobacter algoricola TaxID=486267 RepID=A0ABP7MYC2_9BACT